MNLNEEARNLMNKMLAEKAEEEQREADNVEPLTADEIKIERQFLSTWTQKGRLQINKAVGNFFIPGKNRKRGSIFRPAQLRQLIDAGLLRRISETCYEFIPE